MTDIVYNKNGIPFDIDALATDVNGKMDRDGLNALASVCVESNSWNGVCSGDENKPAGLYACGYMS